MKFSNEYGNLNQDLTADLEDEIDSISRDYLLTELLVNDVFTQFTDNIILNINKMISAVNPAYLKVDKKLDELKKDVINLYRHVDSAYEEEDQDLATILWEDEFERLEGDHDEVIEALGRAWEFKDEHDFTGKIREWKEELERGSELVEEELEEMKKRIFKNKENIIMKIFGEDSDWEMS